MMSAFEKNTAGETAQNKTSVKQGVYVLANDGVFDAFLALLHSLRRHDPGLPLTVIPYNDSLARLRQLQTQFPFDILEEAPCRRFDALARQINGSDLAAGMFRKQAAFSGPYDQFVYLDADIIVTTPLSPILKAFSESPYDLLYFEPDMEQVYAPELAAKMIATCEAQGFNAGAFVARKGLVGDADLQMLAPPAAELRAQLIISAIDQPFLNYVMHRLRRRLAPANTFFPAMAGTTFAHVPFRYHHGTGRAVRSDGRYMPFIHWAGFNYPYYIIRPEAFLAYRTQGLNSTERLRYHWKFYYRRFKRKLKHGLQRSKPTPGW